MAVGLCCHGGVLQEWTEHTAHLWGEASELSHLGRRGLLGFQELSRKLWEQRTESTPCPIFPLDVHQPLPSSCSSDPSWL